MGGERKFVSGADPHDGEKPSRTHARRSDELHGPKPEDGVFASPKKMKRVPRNQGRERESSGRIEDEFEAAFGFRPEVGVCFTDTAEPNEVYEITRVQANGGIEVAQTSDKSGGNYIARRGLSRAWLETLIKENLQGTRKLSLYELSEDDIAELAELGNRAIAESNQNLSQAALVSENALEDSTPEVTAQGLVVEGADQLAGDPPGMTRPKPGAIKGALFGGKTVEYNDSSPEVLPEGSQDEGAIDEQQPTRRRRRKDSSRKARPQLSDEIGETPVQPPKSQEALGVQDVEAQPNPTDNNEADTMKFEQAPSRVPKSDEERSIVDALGEDDLSKRTLSADQSSVVFQSGANDEELIGFGRTYGESESKTGAVDVVSQTDSGVSDESVPSIVRTRDNPLHTVNPQPRGSDDQYRDGSVWVEDYLKETDQQADAQEALQREAVPAVVRTRNHPLRTENQKTQAEEPDGEIENARMAAPGSAEEAAVFEAFGRGPNGEIGATPEGQLQQRIDVATLACDQARLEYVAADNESRTVMSRLKGVLGISGKGIQNETVGQKKEIYQNKLRELRDLRLEMVKMRHIDRTESEARFSARVAESDTDKEFEGMESSLDAGKSFSDSEDSLEKELESELRHFATEVNVGLYNAWTELRSEQKGILGKLKQFGSAYNQLSWQKKLVIGIPVAGLAVASGAGLLGTAMASAAIAAVIARRGVAAAGMFAATDGGLQKLAESRARKMAEKIVAKGQQEARSLESLDQGDASEAGMAGSEAQSSPEANEETLDVKFERMKTFMDNHMIDSLDQTLESRVRGHDRRRLGALAGSMGVAFGLPTFLASETGREFTSAAAAKAGAGARWVGETVFGDDYPQAKPGSIPGGTTNVPPNEATAGTKAAAPATIERGASGSALESPAPAKGVELGGNISGILGKEITLAKGDSVWKLAGNMAKELGVKGDAESLYVTDVLKDAYLAHGGNPNIQAGAVFNWKKYLSAEDIQKALKASSSLTEEQKASILANKGKDIASALVTGSTPTAEVFTLGSDPQNIVSGESKYPDVLARARVQLAGDSQSTVTGGVSGQETVRAGVFATTGDGTIRADSGRSSSMHKYTDKVDVVTTVTNGNKTYEIPGVRPDQLENTTESARVSEAGNGSRITVESAPQSREALETSRQVGGGAEGFIRVADTTWEGTTPTVDLIAIDQVRPIVDRVPNMTCQEFFQVYLDAKDAVSNNYDQINTLTFQGGLSWAEVDTFAQFINGFTDPDSGRKLIVQAVRANPNITLKEFIEMYAPSAEPSPSPIGGQVENAVPNIGSEPIASSEVPAAVVAESTPSAPAESSASVSVAEPVLTEESVRQESSIATVEPSTSDTEQSLDTTVNTGVVTAANESGIAIGEESTSGGETLVFSQHVEPNRESFQQVRYEADPASQQGGTGRGMSARAGMPPAGGFESNPKIPGIGPINLMELQFAEQKLRVGPAAQLTLRQLAESGRDPSKIPSGMTPEDLAKIKRLLVRVPGTNTGPFILQNGNMTVQQFIRDNIRARIPRPGSTSI